jgi:hypothetical protein
MKGGGPTNRASGFKGHTFRGPGPGTVVAVAQSYAIERLQEKQALHARIRLEQQQVSRLAGAAAAGLDTKKGHRDCAPRTLAGADGAVTERAGGVLAEPDVPVYTAPN